MSFGDMFYYIILVVFIFMTFGIIKNYYKNKFDDEGRRIDMLEDEDKKSQ